VCVCVCVCVCVLADCCTTVKDVCMFASLQFVALLKRAICFAFASLQIKPAECRYEVLKSKIEITLLKADGAQWVSVSNWFFFL